MTDVDAVVVELVSTGVQSPGVCLRHVLEADGAACLLGRDWRHRLDQTEDILEM